MRAFILFQRGATGWGFQIGRLHWQVNYLRFWFKWRIGHVGWDTSDRE